MNDRSSGHGDKAGTTMGCPLHRGSVRKQLEIRLSPLRLHCMAELTWVTGDSILLTSALKVGTVVGTIQGNGMGRNWSGMVVRQDQVVSVVGTLIHATRRIESEKPHSR